MALIFFPFVSGCGEPPAGIVWPLSGSAEPDWPVASTYGPRLTGSGVYDFHRGIDIPAPEGSDVVSILAGKVTRIDKSNPKSGISVQVEHHWQEKTFYSVYSHLAEEYVVVGDQVETADVLGLSGVGEAGSPHVHFEIRDGVGHRENCVHPLGYLPYTNATTPALTIESVDITDPLSPAVTVSITIPSHEIDLSRVEVSLLDMVPAVPAVLDERVFDFAAWNLEFTVKGDGDTLVDNPDLNDIHVAPEKFSKSSDAYRIEFTFSKLSGLAVAAPLGATARATDALGKTTEVSYP